MTCKERWARWSERNPDGVLASRRRYCEKNKKKLSEKSRKWREQHLDDKRKEYKDFYRSNRAKVFDHYGWACACCGENHKEFLTVHHVNGDGAVHRKIMKMPMYYWLIKNGFPEGFQTLCYNCNCAKGKNGGDGLCPHERERRLQDA